MCHNLRYVKLYISPHFESLIGRYDQLGVDANVMEVILALWGFLHQLDQGINRAQIFVDLAALKLLELFLDLLNFIDCVVLSVPATDGATTTARQVVEKPP